MKVPAYQVSRITHHRLCFYHSIGGEVGQVKIKGRVGKVGQLSESGFTGLEDFQDKSGGGRVGTSSIRDRISQHLSCVDRDRHGFDNSLWLSYVYLNDFAIPKINLHKLMMSFSVGCYG